MTDTAAALASLLDPDTPPRPAYHLAIVGAEDVPDEVLFRALDHLTSRIRTTHRLVLVIYTAIADRHVIARELGHLGAKRYMAGSERSTLHMV